MGLKQDIAGTEAYIARATKRLAKQRRLIDRSRNEQTVAAARDLVDVLTVLLINVEQRRQRLQERIGDSKRKH